MIEEINKKLISLSGNNNLYYSNVIPSSKKTYGVTIPNLRTIAKEIAKNNYKYFLENNPLDTLEMEVLQSLVIGYAKDDIDVLLKYLDEYIPKIHDWCTCDTLCQNFKIARKYPDRVLEILLKYKKSNKEYEVRVIAVLLMSHYLNDKYIDKVIKIIDKLKANDYYSRMGVAWCVATIMAKYPEKCLKYLENNNLDEWTFNKSIQKMKESFRVSQEIKECINNKYKK